MPMSVAAIRIHAVELRAGQEPFTRSYDAARVRPSPCLEQGLGPRQFLGGKRRLEIDVLLVERFTGLLCLDRGRIVVVGALQGLDRSHRLPGEIGGQAQAQPGQLRLRQLPRHERFVDGDRPLVVLLRLSNLGETKRGVFRQVTIDLARGQVREDAVGFGVAIQPRQRQSRVVPRVVGDRRGRQRAIAHQRQRRGRLAVLFKQAHAADKVGEGRPELRALLRHQPHGRELARHRRVRGRRQRRGHNRSSGTTGHDQLRCRQRDACQHRRAHDERWNSDRQTR